MSQAKKKQFPLRLTEEDRAVLQQAMVYSRDVSMSNFILRQALRAATLLIEEGSRRNAAIKELDSRQA